MQRIVNQLLTKKYYVVNLYHKDINSPHTEKEEATMKKKNLYGYLGFLSLLGLIGIFTEERSFLAFFAFAVDFQYFFIPSDEMLEEYMNRATSRGFIFGMISMAAAVLVAFLIGMPSSQALMIGCTLGWGVSVAVYSLSSAYYGFKESRGMQDD